MRPLKTGLTFIDAANATDGCTLFTPLDSHITYLIDLYGNILHSWDIGGPAGAYAYLLSGGNLLASSRTATGPNPAGGKGGHLKEFDWNGDLVWEYTDDAQHHDFRRLSNGNTIYIGWEKMPHETRHRVIGASAGSEDPNGDIWSDFLKEVDRNGNVVWEWHAHTDMELEQFPLHPLSTRSEFAHCNACAETPDGDILLSFRKISTIALIDKSSKTVKWHMRDDNWGQQHDCSILDNGNILLFANGIHVPLGVFHSAVIEIDPGAKQEVWRYQEKPAWNFFSPNISGAQRLWTGNTLICEGLSGRLFEVTTNGELAWEFVNPHFTTTKGGPTNRVFRAYRYRRDSSEIANRL